MRGLTACMRCGSLELRSAKASEGSIGVAFFDLAHCRACGWQGMPLEFEDEASWRAFVEARKGWRDEVQVAACRQCGARDIRLEGTSAFCPHCWWRGDPVEFPDEAAWRAFAEERKNWKGRGGEAG